MDASTTKTLPAVSGLFMALMLATAADARIPLMNHRCPGNINVHAEAGGPVYINGKEAALKAFGDNRYEATAAGVTVTVTVAPNGSSKAAYSANDASGVCREIAPPSDDNG